MRKSRQYVKRNTIFMLIAAAGLVALACWLGRKFDIDPPWAQVHRLSRQTNSRGESIGIFFALAVFDAKTGEHRWSADLPIGCSSLVGDHYLAGVRDGKFVAVDIDDALAVPITFKGRAKYRAVQWQPFELDAHELNWILPDYPKVFSVPGTNCFLVISPGAKPANDATVYAVEIESRQLRLLAQWNSANGGLFVLPTGQVNSVTPDGKQIEVRSPKDFSVVRTLPFPTGVNSRQVSSRQVQTRNYLMSYPDPTTGVSRVHRLDDLSPIPELDIPLLRSNHMEVGEDRKYHILSDGNLSASRRLVVYDAVDRRIVYDSGPALGFKFAKIQDGQLHLSTLVLGMTTQIIDLEKGRVARVERPLLWIIIAMPGVLVAALVWLSLWISQIPTTRKLLPLNILFVALLFIAPLFHRSGREGFSFFGFYPTVQFSLATVLGLFFCLSVYAAMCRGRLLLRAIPVLACMSILLIVIEARLIEFRLWGGAAISFRLCVTFTVFALVTLYSLRYLGWKLTRAESDNANQLPHRASVHLLDIFVLTACVALAVKVFGPHLDLLNSPERRWYVIGRSALLTAMSCLGLLAFARSDRIYRAAVMLAICTAILGIVDIVLHVSLESHRNQLWYRIASDARYPLFLTLASFAFCSMMRRAGYRWANVARLERL